MDNFVCDRLGITFIFEKFADYLCFEDSYPLFLKENQFLNSKTEIENIYKKITYLLSHIKNGAYIDFKIESIADILKKIDKPDFLLSQEQVAGIFLFIKNSIKVNKIFTEVDELKINFDIDFSLFVPVYKELKFFLLDSGEINFNLPEFQVLNSKILDARNRISKISKNLMGINQELYSLKNEIQRDGRVVLPLKSNYKGVIKGIIHTTSDSGNTLFIEPFELVEYNNLLIKLNSESQIIVKKILKKISKIIFNNSSLIFSLNKKFIDFDIIYAKTLFILKNNLTICNIGDNIILHNAIHPDLKNPIPLKININSSYKNIIISGPNAGGKTVLLKIIGLNVFLFQSGFGVFADENSQLPIFDNIFLEMGDHQSIENQVSTYSAHLNNLKHILNSATKNSLILLDEFASGTDFFEGGAIAIATLNFLKRVGSSVILTTHNSLVKDYGIASASLMLSMEFDTKNFIPTYKIIENQIGESHAIDIATYINYDKNILSEAKLFLEKNSSDTGKIIKDINEKKRIILAKERELSEKEVEVEKIKLELNFRDLKLKEDRYLLEKEKKNLNLDFFKNQKKELQEFIKNSDKNSVEMAENFIQNIDKNILSVKEDFNKSEASYINSKNDFLREGMDVNIGENKRRGKLIRKEGKNRWIVLIGSMYVSTSEADIYIEKNKKIGKRVDVKYTVEVEKNFSCELDLRGKFLKDAILELEKYLDKALLYSIPVLSILHGTGEGVLQKGIHQFLKNIDFVQDYYFAIPEEGGFGKTYIKLKK